VLVRRMPLSYPVTLLCVLLREKLLEFDAQGDSSRLIVSRERVSGPFRGRFQVAPAGAGRLVARQKDLAVV
jgi:hypothetical protein